MSVDLYSRGIVSVYNYFNNQSNHLPDTKDPNNRLISKPEIENAVRSDSSLDSEGKKFLQGLLENNNYRLLSSIHYENMLGFVNNDQVSMQDLKSARDEKNYQGGPLSSEAKHSIHDLKQYYFTIENIKKIEEHKEKVRRTATVLLSKLKDNLAPLRFHEIEQTNPQLLENFSEAMKLILNNSPIVREYSQSNGSLYGLVINYQERVMNLSNDKIVRGKIGPVILNDIKARLAAFLK